MSWPVALNFIFNRSTFAVNFSTVGAVPSFFITIFIVFSADFPLLSLAVILISVSSDILSILYSPPVVGNAEITVEPLVTVAVELVIIPPL